LHRLFNLGLRRGKIPRDIFLTIISFPRPFNQAAFVSFFLSSFTDVTIVGLSIFWIYDCLIKFRDPSLEDGIHSSQILNTFFHLFHSFIQASELGIVGVSFLPDISVIPGHSVRF
jgi:hypothetical protein